MAVERRCPAKQCVLSGGKRAILDAAILANYRVADITIEHIADLMKYDFPALRRS
jgi:hypothetical protein